MYRKLHKMGRVCIAYKNKCLHIYLIWPPIIYNYMYIQRDNFTMSYEYRHNLCHMAAVFMPSQ